MYYNDKTKVLCSDRFCFRSITCSYKSIYLSERKKNKSKETKCFSAIGRGWLIDIDEYGSLNYEIGRGKQEHEFFGVPEMNRDIILGRDWLTHFGVHMSYDIGCTNNGKSYVKMEEEYTYLH